MLKEFTRSLGLDPEKILVKEAIAEPHRVIIDGRDEEKAQIQALSEALKDWLRREVLAKNGN